MRKMIVIVAAMIFALSGTALAAAPISEIVIDFPSSGIVGLPDVPNFVEVPADAAEVVRGVVEVMPGDNIRIKLPTTADDDMPCKC